MSWVIILGFALSVFFLLLFFLSRFIRYMKEEQNMEIESLKDTLIDKDNPVGLSGEELETLKQQQAEAQRHLREVISKIPVIQKEGRFQVDYEKIKETRESHDNNNHNGTSDTLKKDNV
jgi:predicted nucleotidyltransferase